MPFDVYLNVAVGGILTGLVYGLMALGLSVIFGVVRVVNFAHGEMMTIAMYIAVDAVRRLPPRPADHAGADRRGAVRLRLRAAGAADQSVHHAGPSTSQFLLLVAVAIIIVNVLLIVFGPDARTVQASYAYDSFQLGPLIVDATKLYAGLAAIVVAAALFAFFRYTRSAPRSAPAPTTTPARWWSGSTSSISTP